MSLLAEKRGGCVVGNAGPWIERLGRLDSVEKAGGIKEEGR